jgi:hypothetical protein
MAFADGTLTKVSGHANSLLGGFWEYKENATVATIAASGYFNAATKTLQQYDVLVIRGSNGTALAQVTSATGATTVTVGAFTGLT